MTRQQVIYLQYIRQKILYLPSDKVDEVFAERLEPEQEKIERFLRLLTQLAHCMRTSNNFSIDKAIDDSIRSSILSTRFLQLSNRKGIRVIFFNFIAWINTLYPPRTLARTTHGKLAIDSQQCVYA